MATHGYSYIVDLDEFIVPREALAHRTTPALVAKIAEFKRAPGNKSTDAFLFKNTFFCRYLRPVTGSASISSTCSCPSACSTSICSTCA